MTVLGTLSAPDHNRVVSSVRQVVPSTVETPPNTLSLLGFLMAAGGLNESLARCSEKVEHEHFDFQASIILITSIYYTYFILCVQF